MSNTKISKDSRRILRKLKQSKICLHLAAKSDQLPLVRTLLKHGADINIRDKEGLTPLHIALENENWAVANYLIKNMFNKDLKIIDYFGSTPLHVAADRCSLKFVKSIVKKGGNVNVKDGCGMTPLHIASIMSNMDIAKVLLNAGADIEIQDNSGFSPLHWAVKVGNVDLVKCLVELKADMRSQNRHEETPLHTAILHRKLSIAEYMLDFVTDINIMDDEGHTPLHLAVELGLLDLVKAIFKHGGDLNVKDINRQTPLHTAIENDLCDVAKWLLARQPHLNSKDFDGNSPLHIAVQRHCSSCVSALLEWGASLTVLNYERRLPLQCACGQFDITHILKNYNDAYTEKLMCIHLLNKKDLVWENCSPTQISYLEELKRMKDIRHGIHSVYDTLTHYHDPLFVANKSLELEIKFGEAKFPLYYPHVNINFKNARHRNNMINEVQVYFNVCILPDEMKRKVLTYLSDSDLSNIISTVHQDVLVAV